MAASQPQQPLFPPPSTPIPVEIPADSSVWDRISTWVSEHKAVVYTIAGVTVAVAAGGIIYYSTPVRSILLLAIALSCSRQIIYLKVVKGYETNLVCHGIAEAK